MLCFSSTSVFECMSRTSLMEWRDHFYSIGSVGLIPSNAWADQRWGAVTWLDVM